MLVPRSPIPTSSFIHSLLLHGRVVSLSYGYGMRWRMIAGGRRSSTLVVKTGGGHIELVLTRRGAVSLGGMIIGRMLLLLLLVVLARRRIVGIRSHSGGIVGKSGRDRSAVHVAVTVAAFGRDAGSLEKVGRQVARVALLKGTLLGWYYRSR
eukprot:scaffold38146_cov44-Attheya_sp.AAC.3